MMRKSVVAYCRARVVRSISRQYSGKSVAAKSEDKKLEESYKILKIPQNSEQDVARAAFLRLAKKYHPDSGSPQANIDKFVAIENAFRTITKHHTGSSSNEDYKQMIFDIKHTAPQHRQYLNYDAVGHGTPYQRQKQWQRARAQKASENVMEHRVAKSLISDDTLMVKGRQYSKKHDIKTKYGFDRLVEDLIQESMSKGEFDNLSGKGKPLKNQNNNPYVDFTVHKLNEVLINNGFTPEWIMMNKEIDQEIEALKEELKKDRMYLGPYPFSLEDQAKWEKIYKSNKELAGSINTKINTYNLIVPLLQKQKFHVEFDKICEDILKNGVHSVVETVKTKEIETSADKNSDFDVMGMLLKAFSEIFVFGWKKKNNMKSVE